MRAIAAGLSSASQRPPSAPKALLRGEVVGVGLRGVDRQAAGARGGVDQDQRLAGVGGAADVDHDAGRGLVVGPGDRRRRRRRPRGSGASPGSASTTIGSAEERRRGGRLGELLRELAVGEVQRARSAPARPPPPPRRRWCRRCRARPRSPRAARRARRGRCELRRRGREPAPGGARCRSARRGRPAPRAPPGAPSRGRSRSGRRPASAQPGSGSCRSSAAPPGDRLLTAAGGPVFARSSAGFDAEIRVRLARRSPTRIVQPGGAAMYPISYEADFNPNARTG